MAAGAFTRPVFPAGQLADSLRGRARCAQTLACQDDLKCTIETAVYITTVESFPFAGFHYDLRLSTERYESGLADPFNHCDVLTANDVDGVVNAQLL
jgi:hypothetical protein